MPWKSTAKWEIIGRNPPAADSGRVTTGMADWSNKQRLARYKNGMLRFRFGPQFGATQKKFFLGVEAGFEYSYVFQNGWEFSLIQKNNVNFLHGDTFRNGLLLGVKIPF